jgi:hypothetical protein
MIRQAGTDARRLTLRPAADAYLLGLGGTPEQLLRPGQGRQRG